MEKKKRPFWIAASIALIGGAGYVGNAVNLIQLPDNLRFLGTTLAPIVEAIRPYGGTLQGVVIGGVILLIAYGLDAPTWLMRVYHYARGEEIGTVPEVHQPE